LSQLRVATVHNGRLHRADVLAGMTFSPAELLSFHSQVMPFRAGDIISTGTPGAVGITGGDTVSCDLGGLSLLSNPVVDGAPLRSE
jgi:2-keto-4-pentenoate hydratase/2-oxohepta-3-ene-1,7-dioic acid hydratase in catechol pathway